MLLFPGLATPLVPLTHSLSQVCQNVTGYTPDSGRYGISLAAPLIPLTHRLSQVCQNVTGYTPDPAGGRVHLITGYTLSLTDSARSVKMSQATPLILGGGRVHFITGYTPDPSQSQPH